MGKSKTSILTFSYLGIPTSGKPNLNPVIQNNIEYFIQMNKAVFEIGENIKLLFNA